MTEIKMPTYLYHGTSSDHLQTILRQGIKPRGKKRKSNWKGTVESNPDTVYLTRGYAGHFARSACEGTSQPIVFEISTKFLKEDLFRPDEDFLEQASRTVPEEHPFYVEGDMKHRTEFFRANAGKLNHQFPGLALRSIEFMGTVGYRGTIPLRAIHAYIKYPQDVTAILHLGDDPTITTINWSLLGWRYSMLLDILFKHEPTEQQLKEMTAYEQMMPKGYKPILDRLRMAADEVELVTL